MTCNKKYSKVYQFLHLDLLKNVSKTQNWEIMAPQNLSNPKLLCKTLNALQWAMTTWSSGHQDPCVRALSQKFALLLKPLHVKSQRSTPMILQQAATPTTTKDPSQNLVNRSNYDPSLHGLAPIELELVTMRGTQTRDGYINQAGTQIFQFENYAHCKTLTSHTNMGPILFLVLPLYTSINKNHIPSL